MLVTFADDIFGTYKNVIEPDDKFKIVYPKGNMFESYDSIIEDLKVCHDERRLKIIFVDIMIFQGSFPDSEKFTYELLAHHKDKEIEIKGLHVE